MYSTRIFVVAVVDFVVKPDYSADRCLDFDYFGIVDYQAQQDCLDYSDLLKDLNLTEGISSRDEILYLRQRPLAGAGTWWSACCTAQLAWPAGFRVDRDGPVKTKKIRQLVLQFTTDLQRSKTKFSRENVALGRGREQFCLVERRLKGVLLTN